ncbi:MAG: PqqD family protein [Bacteroidaceae bacterium]|nr:PqqD family protein [Bacteroidaceae bacterium]
MKVKEGFEMQVVCGEHIIIPAGAENVDFSKIISLNPTAAYLWENVAKKESFSVEDMVELLLAEYEVEREIALEDCNLIAETWKEMGLVQD